MMKLRECLEILKVSRYIIYQDKNCIGEIKRDFFEDNKSVGLLFTNKILIDKLDICVVEILPHSDGCNLVLESFADELPFY